MTSRNVTGVSLCVGFWHRVLALLALLIGQPVSRYFSAFTLPIDFSVRFFIGVAFWFTGLVLCQRGGKLTGLILERAREPDALYFALGLSCFASSEPGWLSVIDGIDSLCSSRLSIIY